MAEQDAVINGRQPIDDGIVVQVAGEIDLVSSPQLRVELMELVDAGHDRLVVDLSGVPFMDSSGVATLVEALQRQRHASRQLVLCGLQPKVRSIFEISRLDMVFPIAPDASAAGSI